MAVPFLPQTQPVFPGNADLSKQLMLLGDTIGQNIKGYRRQSLLGDVLENGQVDYDKTILSLLQIGDIESAKALATHRNSQLAASGVYGTPIYGTDAQGNTVLGAIGKQGQFQKIDTGGVQVNPGIKVIDTGTGSQVIDTRTGMPVGGNRLLTPPPQQGPVPPQQQGPGLLPAPPPASDPTMNIRPLPVPTTSVQPPAPSPDSFDTRFGRPGYYPKDIAGKAEQQKFGTEQGEAKANLASLRSKLPGLVKVVEELGRIGDKATYTMTGQAVDFARKEVGMSPRDAAVARTQYTAMVDNQVLPLLRDTFGAQFTQKEGESLKLTLGDPNKTPQEKRAVLNAFIEQKVRDLQGLERRTAPSTPKSSGAVDWKTYFGKQ